MAGQDTAAYDEVLKTVYEGGIRELIPLTVKTLQKFEDRDATAWSGRHIEYPIKVGRNQGVGWGAEMGAIPSAGRQDYTNVRIPMRFGYIRVQFSYQVMRASQGNKAAFAPVMEQEMSGAITDFANERGRMIFGDGRGILAIVNGDPGTGTTVTVDSPGGFAGAINGARFLNRTARVTFVAPATGTIVASADETVVSVPASGLTFTTNSAVDTAIADNDYVVRAHKAGLTDVSDTSFNKEPMGLSGLIDDGTYVQTLHGVNRTTYPIFASTVISNASAISADLIQRIIDLAEQRGGGTIDDLRGHHSVRRAYIAMMDGERRYMGGDLQRPDAGTVAAKGGRLTFGGIPFEVDKYAPYGTIFASDTSTFRRYVEIAGEWMKDGGDDGTVLHLVGTGTGLQDAYEGAYRIWDNFHVEKPNTCGRIDGITSTVITAHVD